MSDGDVCPKCGEEFYNCSCPPLDDEDDLYDGWYDPGK